MKTDNSTDKPNAKSGVALDRLVRHLRNYILIELPIFGMLFWIGFCSTGHALAAQFTVLFIIGPLFAIVWRDRMDV
jgi:hypothetical protein